MATLKIWKAGISSSVEFEPPCPLDRVLGQNGAGVKHPCGGRGTCAKCRVTVCGNVSEPNALERAAGARLSCQIHLLGDAQVWLPEDRAMEQIELSGSEQTGRLNPMEGKFGAAIDIGTTTLALKLYDLSDGRCIGSGAMENPQKTVAADVMGRIQAALSGEAENLRDSIRLALESMLEQACQDAACLRSEVDAMVAAGNTTMLYLLMGQKTHSLATAPFKADRLFDEEQEILGMHAYLPPCMNAFVGADISCAVLSSGMCRSKDISLLCDIGTNGEIALWKDGRLYVTSTAAGPAFEGAGISCGCGSVRGAIDKVWVENGTLRTHTIGDAPAVGICGSGLLDAVAAGLELEEIEDSGFLEAGALALSEDVKLLQQDIRAVQLAKAAIAAGMETLLLAAGVSLPEIKRFYIAGGFGSHLNIASAVRIGLIPAQLSEKVTVVGNAALAGAGQLLLDMTVADEIRRIASAAEHINLGGNPVFGEKFIDRMILEKIG